MRVIGKRRSSAGAVELARVTFSPSANLTMRNAPLKYIESTGMPQRILMTRDCPPIVLALPCSRFAAVTPPASAR